MKLLFYSLLIVAIVRSRTQLRLFASCGIAF